jgi:hypothetical protein
MLGGASVGGLDSPMYSNKSKYKRGISIASNKQMPAEKSEESSSKNPKEDTIKEKR